LKDNYNSRLKKSNWHQWKASRLRSSWRARAKKLKVNLDDVPTREEIQDWLISKEPFKCYLTDISLNKGDIELDHKEVTSKGGSFKLFNIGITSKFYNSAKGDMAEKEFLSLLKLIKTWPDKGQSLLKRLRSSNNMFRRKKYGRK
jgi:hypothetical protein